MDSYSDKRQRGDSDDFGRGRGGFRGRGRGGGFRGGRGGGAGGGDFDKTAGGDFQRMPASVENKELVSQKLGYGTEGKPVELVANFYRITHSNVQVHHYDFEIIKYRPPRK